jgi:hypothetical protein
MEAVPKRFMGRVSTLFSIVSIMLQILAGAGGRPHRAQRRADVRHLRDRNSLPVRCVLRMADWAFGRYAREFQPSGTGSVRIALARIRRLFL